ncbi:MAG: VOC family protein [Sphingobacteriales bacterium JAD_PAG50586_3]|nr:MAG: VOC family protein [Sphingobacteriales bacterium JAD_PAG50586_3]
MNSIVPYLNYNGDAEAAFNFYVETIGGKIEFMQRFGDVPNDMGADKDKILHLTATINGSTLMASDCPPGVSVSFGNNVNLSLNMSSAAELDEKFAKLAEGGTITMAPEDTFWGARFAMLVDKFGICWMFNFDYPKEQ